MTSTLFAAPVYQSYGRQIADQRYEGGGILMSQRDVGWRWPRARTHTCRCRSQA
jgi:hypothetical protein